jgi:hypothetical protein
MVVKDKTLWEWSKWNRPRKRFCFYNFYIIWKFYLIYRSHTQNTLRMIKGGIGQKECQHNEPFWISDLYLKSLIYCFEIFCNRLLLVFTRAILKKGWNMSFWWGTPRQALRRPISSKGVHYTRLCKNIAPIQVYLIFHFLSFFQPHHMKLKLGLQIGGRLLIDNDLNQLLWLWLANQLQQGVPVISYLFHTSLVHVRLSDLLPLKI